MKQETIFWEKKHDELISKKRRSTCRNLKF